MYDDSLLLSAASHVIATCAYLQLVLLTSMYSELLSAARPCVSQPGLHCGLLMTAHRSWSLLMMLMVVSPCGVSLIIFPISGRLNLSEHDERNHPETAD